MLSGIYTITNTTNNKIYVGKTKNFYFRWASHISGLRKNKHSNKHLQNAWNKYGEECFKFEILENCEENFLYGLEHYWCNILNVHDEKYGYNIERTHPYKKSYGPMLGRTFTAEHKLKIGNSNRGRKISEESKKKMSLARLGKEAPMKGKKLSKERCEFIANMNRGKIAKNRVSCSINNIEYACFTEASEKTGISLHTIRNRCLNENFKDYKILKEK
jgi:group I intron endonuclease